MQPGLSPQGGGVRQVGVQILDTMRDCHFAALRGAGGACYCVDAAWQPPH